MRNRQFATGALALGVILFVDVLRVWLPGIITIFGQAASTPAELMGAFALAWFVLALAAPVLVGRLGAGPVTVTAGVVLAVARLALTAAPGGRIQLWLATAGLLAGLVWLSATATTTARPVPGLALGLAANAAGHALLDTQDLVWRGGWAGWLGSVALVALYLTALASRTATPHGSDPPGAPTGPAATAGSGDVASPYASGRAAGAGGVRAWLLAGPALLLAGMLALSPALARTGTSYLVSGDGVAGSPLWGLVPLPVAVAGFLLAALTRPAGGPARAVGPVALLAGAVLFALDRGDLLVPAMLLAAVGLGACLALAGAGTLDRPGEAGDDRRRGYAAAVGMLVFALGAVGYYSAYDLGYPNAAVPVSVALLVAVVAGTTRPASRTAGRPVPVRTAVALTALALLTPVVADGVPVASNRGGPPERLTVVAYNVRMGFGLDGRFDLSGLAGIVSRQRPDVVLLSEVDRGWLLNGGHDTLDLLADRLDMPYVFAPAADPVWGDAVLSRWPMTGPRTLPLPAVGAPTGAQALAVTLDLGDGVRTAVVSTHLQPPPGEGPVVQARAVADFAVGYAAGRPLVVGGDLNTEPGDEAFGEFTRVGLVDALAAARPLGTSPADDPRNQIDHVFVSPGLTAAGAVAPRGTASDHLPVAVTVTLPPR
ncbi:endonuclease/exonuclease/phosphatase family protein [Micromonospora endolithica]|uniref:Endonuclease n=1 Tax=Micromonospora endolithica TaxID=230091 RepID=A0A3A9ZM64_9ACTN|nr:endonuclease/exonuclease/phosphatase family protein [Micromonospora endolithica]RKN49378.1 endonuclease [Micromonospora endolithica]TWJ23568.1 endonuclease/exonuclease/phosphatase family metal-dependent hydrolase [Micromonospora endolithica]